MRTTNFSRYSVWCCVACCFGIASAEEVTVTVDGVNYVVFVEDGNAAVTANPDFEGDLVIPESIPYGDKEYDVTIIQAMAFRNNTKLTSVKFGSKVNRIGQQAFYGCEGLTEIEIPETVQSVAQAAFMYCSNLKTAVVKNENAFADECGSMFSDCIALENVELPLEMPAIGDRMFYNCKSLKRIGIPEKVTSIGQYAFKECTALTEITFGENIVKVGDNAFQNCTALSTINYNNTNYETGAEYWHDVFDGCTGLQTINIAENVTDICPLIFNGCSGENVILNYNAKNASISFSEKQIDGTSVLFTAFALIGGLKTVNISNSVESICHGAFENAREVENLNIGENVTYIGNYAFASCHNLKNVEMPNNIGWLGTNIFKDCISLETVKLSEYKDVITDSMFYGCSSLHTITMSERLLRIEKYAFGYNTSLVNFTIPDEVIEIGSSVFENCTALESVTIGRDLSVMANDAYKGCSNLKTVYMNAVNCIEMGTGVKIGQRVLVKSPFESCIETIIFGEDVTNVPEYAFYYASQLKEITCKSVVPPTCVASAFQNADKTTCRLLVPPGTIALYQAADVWKDFYNIEEYGSSSINDIEYELDETSSTEYYNLQGVRIHSPERGVYIKKHGSQVTKVSLP